MKKEHKCKFCNKEYATGVQLGGHTVWCKLNPNREKNIISSITNHPTKKKRITIKNNCEKCGNEFTQIIKENRKGHINRFCSRSCANGHIHSKNWNKKISDTLKGRSTKLKIDIEYDTCVICKKITIRNKTSKLKKTCSFDCYKRYLSNITKERYKLYPEKHPNRRCAGINESYPEQCCREYLELKGLKKDVDFIQHYDGIKPYFIDFYFPKIKLGVEIDGERWHDRNDIKEIKRENTIKKEINLIRFWAKDITHKKCEKKLNEIICEYNSIDRVLHCR